MFLSEGTVKTHLTNAFGKLGGVADSGGRAGTRAGDYRRSHRPSLTFVRQQGLPAIAGGRRVVVAERAGWARAVLLHAISIQSRR